MNKKILAVCLCFIIACGIFAGCQKKAPDPISIIVTDENGVAVTDASGEVVTKKAVPATDKKGDVVTEKATNSKGEIITDSNGDPKTVVVTVPENETETSTETTTAKFSDDDYTVPYSTTMPENNKKLDEWTFGSNARVGCNAPNGWSNENVNQVVKNGTDIRVIMAPINYLKDVGYKSVDDYVSFVKESMSGGDNPGKVVHYTKNVYEEGTAVAMIIKTKSEHSNSFGYKFGRYQMIYFYEANGDVRSFYVYGDSEKEVQLDITDVIANTYYRG